jgi:hypothetical protein
MVIYLMFGHEFGHPIKMPSSLPFSHGAKGMIFNPLARRARVRVRAVVRRVPTYV